MSPAMLLRKARRASGMTQYDLAVRLGVSQPFIARLERRNANPTWTTLVRALHATGHDLELARRDERGSELDLAQLRERLALTPGERLRAFQASQRNLLRLQASARRRAR